MSENKAKQELGNRMEAFAIIGPNKKQTLRNFILQLGETVLSEIADTTAGSKDYSAIHSCIAAIHMPEDIDNPEKIKKVAQDILHANSDPGIRDRIEYLTGRLDVFTDMALTFRDQEQKMGR